MTDMSTNPSMQRNRYPNRAKAKRKRGDRVGLIAITVPIKRWEISSVKAIGQGRAAPE
jgi:hypothetical protein